MQGLSESLRFLGDSTRLRILRCLAEAPLTVGELVRVLGVGQPTVSHHLAKLKKSGLVAEERNGHAKHWVLTTPPDRPEAGGRGWGSGGNAPGNRGGDGPENVWPLVKLAVGWQDDDAGDLSRLRDLLRDREDRQALNERLLEPGQSWFLWSRALGALLPPVDAADFGCGSGILSLEMARWAKSVVAIDSNAQTLARARERAEAAGPAVARRIRFVKDDLQALKLGDRSLDLVVVSQSLHHVEAPAKVLGEAARVLKPGGHVVVIELAPHREEWVKSRIGHRWLGFEPEQVVSWLKAAGFARIESDFAPSRSGDAFRPYQVTAVVPEEID